MKTLHVIDIENVLGGPIDETGLFNQSKNIYLLNDKTYFLNF